MVKPSLGFFIYFLLFLLPIFWLPFSFEFLEFNKIYLIFFFSWTLLLFWFLKMVLKDKEIRFRWNFFDLFIFLFFLIAIFSFTFSNNKPAGIFGTYGRFNNGLLALSAFFAFFLLIRNNLKLEEKGSGLVTFNGIFNCLFFSSFLALLWTYFSLARFWLKIPYLSKFAIFNPVGASSESLAVFLSLITLLVLFHLLVKKEQKRWEKLFSTLFLVLAFPLLLIFDTLSAWILLGLSLTIFLAFSLSQKFFVKESEKLILPIFLIILSLIFSFLNFESLLAVISGKNLPIFDLPRERILAQGESWQIAFKTLISSLKNGFLGSGPGTFLADFAKFKSDRMREGFFWALRWDRAGNHISEIFATMGFLGGIFFSLILVWLFLLAIFKKTDFLKIPWQMFLIALVILQFIFYQNTVLAGLFWLGLAIGANLISSKEKVFPIKEYPGITLAFETVIIVLALSLISAYFFGIRFYLADHYYQKGFLEADLAKKIDFFRKSSNSNPYQPYYQMILSQTLMVKLQQELAKRPENFNQETIQELSSSALNSAKKAKELAPADIFYQENLANVYRDLIGLAGEAEKWAEKTYQEAILLEPKNPLLYLELGKVQAQMGNIEKARENFNKALDLAPQFILAKVQLALLLEQEGKPNEAMMELEGLASQFPDISQIYFHLSRLYYNNNELEKAIEKGQQAISLFPNYSNAHFILALAFEKKGEWQKAIEELEIVARLNPENEIVKTKIEELKNKVVQPQRLEEPKRD